MPDGVFESGVVVVSGFSRTLGRVPQILTRPDGGLRPPNPSINYEDIRIDIYESTTVGSRAADRVCQRGESHRILVRTEPCFVALANGEHR